MTGVSGKNKEMYFYYACNGHVKGKCDKRAS